MTWKADLTKDSQGRPLEVQQRVAYNLSGQVVPGRIIGFTEKHIEVRTGHRPSGVVPSKTLSKVGQGQNLLVLENAIVPGDPVVWENRGHDWHGHISLIQPGYPGFPFRILIAADGGKPIWAFSTENFTWEEDHWRYLLWP